MKIGYHRASRRPGDVAATWYRESGIKCDAGAFGTPHWRPAMERQLERCCGLDVHKETLAACVRLGGRTGRAEQYVQTFGTTVGDLLLLRDWLRAAGGQ